MSWQEELRRLDEDLASGRLSADEYRTRRDQVLSSAVGQQPQPQQPAAGSNADETQVIAPVSQPSGTPQQQSGDNSAERTQVVSWQAQQGATDPSRTEFVQPPAQAPPYSPPGGMPQQGPASPAGGFPQQQPAWNTAAADPSPPWGGPDLPPLSPGGDPDWIRQGPEFFSDKPRRSKGARIGAIAAAVVVLGGIAFGAYLLWGTGSGGTPANQTTAQQPSTQASTPKPPDPMAVASLPGQLESHDDVKSFDQVSGLNYLNPKEMSAYQAAQPDSAKFVVYHLGNGNNIALLLVKTGSPAAARTAAQKLQSVQVENGAKKLTSAPDGVFASAIDKKDGQVAQVRGHYVHGNVIVRIDVSSQTSLQAAEADFTSAVNQQLQALSADG